MRFFIFTEYTFSACPGIFGQSKFTPTQKSRKHSNKHYLLRLKYKF